MINESIKSSDNTLIKYGYSNHIPDGPWLAFIIPFGLKLDHAQAFFNFFSQYFNVFCWESRLILDQGAGTVGAEDFAIEKHIQDMLLIMDCLKAEQATIVGYCSGAGIALAAANHSPSRFDSLVLVHGEYALLDKPGCTTQFGSDIDNILTIASESEKHSNIIFEKIKDKINFDGGEIPAGIDLPFSEPGILHRYGVNYICYKANNFENHAINLKHKAYMLAGRKDEQSNIPSNETIKNLITNSELYIDDEADHYGVLRPESKTLVQIWNCLCMEV